MAQLMNKNYRSCKEDCDRAIVQASEQASKPNYPDESLYICMSSGSRSNRGQTIKPQQPHPC